MAVNRVTGLNSGMDTESLVTSLVSSYQKKVDTLQGNQKRHSWKQEAWKDLNKKVVSFYNGKLNTMSYVSAFNKKTTTSTNASAVTILTGENAMNATQRMRVKSIASSAFATGKQIKDKDGKAVDGSTKLSQLAEGLTRSTWTTEEPVYETVPKRDENNNIIYKKDENGDILYETDAGGNQVPVPETEQKQVFDTVPVFDENNQPVMIDDGNGNQVQKTEQVPRTTTVTHTGFSLTVNVGNSGVAGAEGVKSETLNFDENATINDVVNKLKSLSVNGQKFNANFDANQGRFYMAAAATGEAGTFSFSGNSDLLTALGLDTAVHAGQDAEIKLNGEDYKSANGTFEINGLTITANEVTPEGEDDFVITTKSDTSGVYDMVKDLLKDYNDLIKELDGKYYADPAKKYNMLTEDEKYAMSDKEVEDWEKHIKDGLLAKDSTIYDVSQALKSIVQGGFEVNGRRMYLSEFGIGTGAYLSTAQGELGVLHIDGDPDDSLTSANADKLKSMIASDPDAVSSFFSQMAQSMRSKLFDMMKTTEYSSSFTIYEDKLMASQYSDYNSRIADATERLNKKQDSYYAKFTRMETAMAKINSVQSNLSGYFGG